MQKTTSTPPRQVWLARLQVINWGVFDGYHDIRLSRSGTLITGASGSGKSSLLDAISLAFLSAKRRNFNASSDSTAAGSNLGRRTVDKYIRGLWGERQQPGERPKPMFLRGDGPVWSAVAVTYVGSDDTAVTGLVLKWLPAGAETDASSSYHLIAQDADILDLCNTWRDRGYAKSVFESAGWQGKRDHESWYLDRLYAATGIKGQTAALQLLGKAKSLKSVGGLEQFVREYMLDVPESYTSISDAVNQITPLVDARNALALAQKKRNTLGDIEDIHQRYASEAAKLAGIDVIDPQMVRDWIDEQRLTQIGPEVTRLDDQIEGIGAERRQLDSERRVTINRRDELTARIAAAGGNLASLRTELAQALERSEDVTRRRGLYDDQLWNLGYPTVDTANDFETMRTQSHTEATRIGEEVKTLQHRLANEEGPLRRAAEDQMAAARKELARVERSRNTVPDNEDRIRGEIAAALGAPTKQLPYVCELMDLQPQFTPWRKAVEKVLRTTGLVLLVPDRYHSAALRYVNDHNMRGLIRIEHVRAEHRPAPRVQPGTLAECLHVTGRGHECASTAESLIATSGDYTRVDSSDDFPQHRRAVTVEGLRQEREGRAVKDDRVELAASKYVFQGNIEHKIAALRTEVDQAEAEFEARNQKVNALHDRISTLGINKERWGKLSTQFERYADVDTDSADAIAQRLQDQLDAFEDAHPDLAKLQQQADEYLELVNSLSGRIAGLDNQQNQHDERRTKLLELQDTLRPGTVGTQARAALEDYRALMSASLDILQPASYRQELDRMIQKEQEQLREAVRRSLGELQRIVTIFDEQFPDDIPNNSNDLDEKIYDYIALCQRIDSRELPQAYDRMLRLITEQAPTAALRLHQLAEDEAQRIEEQIVRVNLGLGSVEFNRGTRLTLHADIKSLAAVTNFNDRARRISARAAAVSSGDQQAIHDQYRDILELRNLLVTESAEARQWARDALDVRNRFTLYCAENDGTTGELIRTYSNAGANSGGEQEKLMAFCLAGALSFNLADPDVGDNRPVFSQLMLDEAFSKSDPVFAQQALSAFRKFGFQLLIVATVQNTTVIQPYIDSVAMVTKRDQPGEDPAASVRTVTVREFVDIGHDMTSASKSARRADAQR